MKLINWHKTCLGILVHSWRDKTYELWFIPRGFKVEPHKHKDEDVEFYHIFGKATVCRKELDDTTKSVTLPLFSKLACFSIPSEYVHWFTAHTFMVALAESHWLKGSVPSSVAVNFQPTN